MALAGKEVAFNGGENLGTQVGVNTGTVNITYSRAPSEDPSVSDRPFRNPPSIMEPDRRRRELEYSKGERVPGTCEWVLEDSRYRSWLQGGTKLLWISGSPGKGKTMLSLFLTEELERAAQKSGTAEVLFHSCSSPDGEPDSASAILRALIHQLVTKRPSLKQRISHDMGDESTLKRDLTQKVLWYDFSLLIKAHEIGTIFCVLHGLDRCDDDPSSESLAWKLADICSRLNSSQTGDVFKLLVVSGHIADLDRFPQVKLDSNTRVSNDVKRFISAKVGEIPGVLGYSDDFQDVRDDLLEVAQGTFLWVSGVLAELSRSSTGDTFRQAVKKFTSMEELPSNLQRAYYKELRRIADGGQREADPVFRWVTMAFRPLTVQELAEISYSQSRSKSQSLQAGVAGIQRQIDIYRALFVVHDDNKISLLHPSIRAFVCRKIQDPEFKDFSIDEERAHFDIARTCIWYIQEQIRWHIRTNSRMSLDGRISALITSKEQHPFLDYAVEYWPHHLKRCPSYHNDMFDKLRDFQDRNRSFFALWWGMYVETTTFPWGSTTRSPSKLHIFSYFGIDVWVSDILGRRNWRHWMSQERMMRHTKDQNGRSPLFYAALGGHNSTIKLLLDSQVDVNFQDKDGETALMAAAKAGKYDAVRLLLKSGASLDLMDQRGRTARTMAESEGHQSIVDLLDSPVNGIS